MRNALAVWVVVVSLAGSTALAQAGSNGGAGTQIKPPTAGKAAAPGETILTQEQQKKLLSEEDEIPALCE